jgi:hypothetical protein
MSISGNNAQLMQQALQAAQQAQETQHAQQAHDTQHAQQAHGHHGQHRDPQLARYVFRHVQPGRPQPQQAPATLRRQPPRQRQQQARGPKPQQDTQQADQADDQDLGKGGVDADGKEGGGKGKQAFEADDGSGHRKPDFSGDDESNFGSLLGESKDGSEMGKLPKDRPRPSKAPRRPVMTADQVLARSGLAQAKALMARAPGTPPADPQAQMQALASLMLACAREPARRDPLKPSPTATMLAGLQAHLASQGDAPPQPMTLDAVKALLVDLAPSAEAAGTASPASENTHLLLPLFVLNASRPRTPGQCASAQDRLQMVRQSPAFVS